MNKTLLLFAALSLGCPKQNILPPRPSLTEEEAQARLVKDAEARQRLSGVVKVQMDGIEGLLASADLDVAVQTPGQLNIAVRSFFDQPMQIYVTDGAVLTIYDATDAAGAKFYRGPVTSRSLQGLFPAEIWPTDVVDLFLARAPAAGAMVLDMAVDEKNQTYEVALREPSGDTSLVRAKLSTDHMLYWKRVGADGATKFIATYEDHTLRAGLFFAQKIRLEVPKNDGVARVVFTVRSAEYNGAALPAEAFALEPPVGTTIYPL